MSVLVGQPLMILIGLALVGILRSRVSRRVGARDATAAATTNLLAGRVAGAVLLVAGLNVTGACWFV